MYTRLYSFLVLFPFFFVFITFSCSRLPDTNIRLSGTIENQGNESLILLYKDALNNITLNDTIIILEDNQFDIELPLKNNNGMYIIAKLNSNEPPLNIYLEKGQHYKIKGDSKALSTAKINGGGAQKLFEEYMNTTQKDLMLKRSIIDKVFQEKSNNEDTAGIVAMDTLVRQILENEMLVQEKFILNNKDNFFSLYLFTEVFVVVNTDYEKAIKVFNLLDPKIRNSPEGTIIASAIENIKPLSKGYILQPFMLPSENLQLDSFSSNYKNNKITLIDFWASWSITNRMQNATLRTLYAKYQSKGFNIVSFSLDTDIEKWNNAKKEDQIVWKQYCDRRSWKSGVCKILHVRSLPTRFLVDSNGFIIARNPSLAEIEAILDTKLNANKNIDVDKGRM